jgi:hypothetical protein
MAYKLNLGSGDSKFPGFLSVDKYDNTADVKADICDLPFADNSVEEIKCYQTIEHIPYHQTQKMFEEMYRVLQPGGTAHIECPDLIYAAVDIVTSGDLEQKWLQHIYGEYHRPWDVGRYGEEAVFHPGSIHYQGWTLKRLKRICEPIGFTVEEASVKHMNVEETLSVILRKKDDSTSPKN